MLLQVESIKNKSLKRVLEHVVYLAILLILIPGFFYFELCIVLPVVVEEWTTPHFVHLCCATFLLVNIIGNMIFGMFTNTSIKGILLSSHQNENWTFCTVCECVRPPRAWHCTICDICILKRDHHCTFFACCVGYKNLRYFMHFTMYIFISMVYAFYYNVLFVSSTLTWSSGLLVFKFLFPLASVVVNFGPEAFYILLVVINVLVGAFTGFLFFYHFNNLIKGKTTPERKLEPKDSIYDNGWKSNLREVYGTRWYLTWISPFISSPLPGDGTKWIAEDKAQ